ncbi:hypothetical protein BC830DRAFT_1110961 [Chytriomyces sp. MP71]|nr:hypothetical protein BC830DRAFT_1110961 [Chytriomyces sp. MP71]
MTNVFELCARLRRQNAEDFGGVTDAMFVEVVSGGDAATAVRGRQRILAALLGKQRALADGGHRVARLIEARKMELRLEIRSNTPAEQRRAREATFNALFDKIAREELATLGFSDWLREKGTSSQEAWFVDAVAFLLGVKPHHSHSRTHPHAHQREELASGKASPSYSAGAGRRPTSRLDPATTHPPLVSKSSSSTASRHVPPAADPSTRIASALKVSSSNMKLAPISPPSASTHTDSSTHTAPASGWRGGGSGTASLVAELESQLRESRRECSVLRREIASLQEALAKDMTADVDVVSISSATGARNGTTRKNASAVISDPRAVEFLKMQNLQMMRHVFEMRELMLKRKY